jgi:hypothetical protein
MNMQNKIKIFILSICIILSGINSVNATTVTSSLVITSDSSIVTTAFFGGAIISGNACPTHCPGTSSYAKTIIID